MSVFPFLLVVLSAIAQAKPLEVEETQTETDLSKHIAYVEDTNREMNIQEILHLSESRWQSNQEPTFNRGYSSSRWWLRLQLRNVSPARLERLLEISYPVLDHIDVYLSQENNIEHIVLGDAFPFDNRPVKHRYFLVPLEWQSGEMLTIYLALQSSSAIQAPLILWEKNALHGEDQTRSLVHGIYFGIMIALVMYNLFVYLVLGERNYLYYVMFVVCMPIFLASLNGFAFQFLWPNATRWNDQVIIVSLAGVLLFGSIFTHSFLELAKTSIVLMRLNMFYAISSVLVLLASFLFPYGTMIKILILLAAVSCINAFVTGCICWKRGNSLARYYTIAWSFLFAGGVTLALNKFHLIPQNTFTEHAAQLGSALEVILLSFALAERFNHERRMRYEAEHEALLTEKKLRKANYEALLQQTRANEVLEQRVKERTQSLEDLNKKLQQMTETDQLTGLKNRRFLDGYLQEQIIRSQRYKHTLAVLLLDVDHFKQFNDTHGHLEGDNCLRMVANCLTQDLRLPPDMVARYGGEEFCVILPETAQKGALKVAERIRCNIESLCININNKIVKITVSIGLAVFDPQADITAETLLDLADQALYKSKELGRNQTNVFTAIS